MPAAPAEAFSDAELAALFAPVEDVAGIVLAVSGGADSLALLVLVDRWRRIRLAGPRVFVATVDHGLRPSSAAEAAMVSRIAGERGLRHNILAWTGTKPGTGIEAAAREARYDLLLDYARSVGADHVLTAHHQDDQAETVLMRLGRGSGLAGLSGMRAERPLGVGVMLARPLLALAKARLSAVVSAAGLTPVIDESNHDPRFARARLRASMPVLAAEGIDAAGVARTAALLRRADYALDHAVAQLLGTAADVDLLAVVRLHRAALAAAPEEIRLRVLARLVQGIGGGAYSPAADRLEPLAAVAAGEAPFKRTVGGVVVRGNRVTLECYREAGRLPPSAIALPSGFAGLWDNRFAIAVGDVPAGRLTLGPLGEDGRREAGVVGKGAAAALEMLPAFRLDGRLIAVPPLGFQRDEARIFAPRAECVLASTFGIADRRGWADHAAGLT